MVLTRQSHLLAALGLLTFVLWFGWAWRDPESRLIHTDIEEVIEYPLEHVQWLRDLYWHGVVDVENGSTVSYTKLELDAEYQKSFQPPLMQDIDLTFPGLHIIDSASAFEEPVSASQKTTVTSLHSPPIANASDMIFGIATLLERLDDSLDHFAHWASGTGARFVVLVDESRTKSEIDAVLTKAKGLNINMHIEPNPLKFDDRYTYLLKAMHDQLDSNTRWAAIIDDDTFFPSLTNLLTLLDKHNASEPQYIGAFSEDMFQMGMFGLIAYGGAGVFLSVPLLNELEPYYEYCVAIDTTGDRRIAQCVLEHSTTRMTVEPALHQLDLTGDATGFYEALRVQPVSVHHWKSWTTFPMDEISLVARMCGESCIFQKYRMANDWQMTNGISIVKYSHDRTPDDFRMEMTWNPSGGKDQDEMFRHSLAPLKPKDPGKISYIMEKAFYDDINDQVRQLYVHRDHEEKHVGVIEVIWRHKSGHSTE